jgi:DNA topoisomerase-3
MSILILAEKPSVGRDLARVLGAGRRGDGYLEGGGYRVTWALGHLVHFAEPNDYGGAWAGRWSLAQLPMIPERWQLRTDARTASQLRIVEGLLNAPDTESIVCATDAGREGEHIFRLIYEHARCRKPFRRLWVSSLTDEAIREGLARLRPGADFDPLARAARARAQADWLVGMNLTRAYTVHNRVLCTIGRVQTPTLAMIVARDQAIEGFVSSFFYELVATLAEGFRARYCRDGETRLEHRAEAERLQRELAPHATGLVKRIDQKVRRHRPPPLYDLTSLQRDANRRFGLTAAQVLEQAQALYETYKLISYPRTESRHIPEDLVPKLPGILRGLERALAAEAAPGRPPAVGTASTRGLGARATPARPDETGSPPGVGALASNLIAAALARLESGHRLGKAYVDSGKLTDHHAILPTGKGPPPGMPPASRRLFDLVLARFVAVFLPDEQVEETRVLLDIGGADFLARGNRVLDPGWTRVDPPRRSPKVASGRNAPTSQPLASNGTKEWVAGETEGPLPGLTVGQTVHVTSLEVVERETQPPRPYDDASLLAAMKNAGREIEDEALAAAMKESGLGTPATRAEIIEKLIRTGYVERQRKQLRATSKGQALIGLVAEPLRSPELTAKWEQRLKDIEQGEAAAEDFNRDIVTWVRGLITVVARGRALTPDQAQVATAPPGRGQGRSAKRGRRSEAATNQSGSGGLPGSSRREEPAAGPASRAVPKVVAGAAAEAVSGRGGPGGSAGPVGLLGPLRCPKCGLGRIIEGRRGFGCARYREGCDFVVWKEVAGRQLTAEEARQLIATGRTGLLQGFTDGRSRLEARLRLDGHWRVVLDFPAPAEGDEGFFT